MRQSKRILIIDDDPRVVEPLQSSLRREGFEVETAGDIPAALRMLGQHQADLVILDISLGIDPSLTTVDVGDGIALLKRIRQHSDVPVIMLTSTDAEPVKLLTFQLGADDYVTKPFHPDEVAVRATAILRRGGRSTERPQSFLDGRLRIHSAARRVVKDGIELHLTPIEFDLLEHLARAAGRALSRRSLLERIHSFDYHGGERSIDVHIRHLRSKIEDDPARPQLILTVRSIGYRFTTPTADD